MCVCARFVSELQSFPRQVLRGLTKCSELRKQDTVFQPQWGWRYNKGHRLQCRLFFYVYQVEDKPVCPFPLPSRCWTPGRKWHHEGWQRFGAMACSSPQFSGAHTLWSWSLSTSTSMMERTTNPNLTEREEEKRNKYSNHHFMNSFSYDKQKMHTNISCKLIAVKEIIYCW